MVPPPLSHSRDGGLDTTDARAALASAIAAHEQPPLSRILTRRGFGPYRGYGEVLVAIQALVDRGARLVTIGRSIRGEPLFALHLGAESGTEPHAETGERRGKPRTSVVLSAVHPNEWIGIETHLALLDRLLDTDLGDRSIISVPVVNPDGVLRVEQNLRAGRRRFVRHNARGVDLNRNFDVNWYRRGILQRLGSFLWSSGTRPASEPEVEALAHHLSERRVDRALSLHSFGGAVLYPMASSVWPILDRAEHQAWATRIARGAAARPYRALPCSWWAAGFTASGLELDWFHERHGALSLLVECSRGGFGLSPARLTNPFAWFNPPRIDAITVPLTDALAPFVRGDRV
jgi:hypothetical protein